jgi:hypothetical protein
LIGFPLLLLGFLFPLHAQSGPDELLRRAIAQVRDTVDRLPRYVCTQTIDRVSLWIAHQNAPLCDWWPPSDQLRISQSDRLSVDVLSTAAGETYSWAGENQFHNQDLLQLVRIRPVSTGGFSGLLRSIFGNDNAFSSDGEVTEKGRKLRQYSFRVPREKSEYWFGTGAERRIVACEGSFLLDPETANLVRLEVKSSEPPQVTGVCQATTTLNYGRTRVNDSEFLLPTSSLFEFVTTRGEEDRNSSAYSNCHEFLAESTLRFEPPKPGQQPSTKAPDQGTLALPEGLPFRVVFTQDIAFRTAAAGDTFAAKLATSIRDASGRVLVPAGTPVVARILDADLWRGRGRDGGILLGAHLIFRLESMTMAGTKRPFVATAAQRVESSDPINADSPTNKNVPASIRQPNVGGLLLAPNTAILEFYGVRPNFVLKAGKQSKWRTGGTGPTPGCLSGASRCE